MLDLIISTFVSGMFILNWNFAVWAVFCSSIVRTLSDDMARIFSYLSPAYSMFWGDVSDTCTIWIGLCAVLECYLVICHDLRFCLNVMDPLWMASAFVTLCGVLKVNSIIEQVIVCLISQLKDIITDLATTLHHDSNEQKLEHFEL